MDHTTPIDVHVGRNVAEQRKANGLSRLALAERIGVTSDEIADFEEGKTRISASRLQDICNALDIPLSALFQDASSHGSMGYSGSSHRTDFARFAHALNAAIFTGDPNLAAILFGQWLADHGHQIDYSVIEGWHQAGIVARTPN